MLKESFTYSDPRIEDVEEIQKAAERAAGLTKQLLIFSRKQVHRPTFVSLNALVIDLINMLRRVLGADIDLKTAFSADLPTIKADPGQIEQIVMNLVVNARDAMPAGGRVTIETALVERSDPPVTAEPQPGAPGRYVRLAVIDTGIGMTKETRARIFEPFFTTKEIGKGTGLGLATVFGIVQQSGGFITVESEPGAGTSFQLFFPEALGHVGADSRHEEAAEDVNGGHEVVLLVEDEDAVRRFVRSALEQNGYRVLEASNPTEAIGLADTTADRIDVLLTDIMMPGMSGVDLSVRLLKTRVDLKVVYMSGYADDRSSHAPFPPGTVFLQKPFAAATLARTLRIALDGVRAAAP
jgi:CheY-like chemotaxis protein